MAVTLNFQEYGQGPALIVLHGLFGSSRNWTSLARRLGESWTVYALDLRNHGDSPWAEDMSYGDMAEDVRAFMDRQGIERAAVVGHSMGGKTAMAFALTHGARLNDLVVVDIAPVDYGHTFDTYIAAMQGLDVAGLGSRGDADAHLTTAIPETFIRAFLLQNLVRREQSLAWRINLQALSANMPALTGFPGQLLDRSHGGRTLVLGGGLSDYIRPEHHPAIYNLFPNAEIEDIPDAGHWVHAEAPESFLAHVESFLAKGLAASPTRS